MRSDVLHRVKDRNVLHRIKGRKATWIGHILRRNCLLTQVIEGKTADKIKVTRRQRRRHKQVLNDLKESKKEEIDRTLLRSGFGRDCGPVVRQTTK